mmetsp:Transcript_13526/g.38355  ORF Transcript_13526/g.38355 Transcript_13526/m.38355 type:complete len:210 (+) Transcript_13526:65-694(+)
MITELARRARGEVRKKVAQRLCGKARLATLAQLAGELDDVLDPHLGQSLAIHRNRPACGVRHHRHVVRRAARERRGLARSVEPVADGAHKVGRAQPERLAVVRPVQQQHLLGRLAGQDGLAHAAQHETGDDAGEERAHGEHDDLGRLQMVHHALVHGGPHLRPTVGVKHLLDRGRQRLVALLGNHAMRPGACRDRVADRALPVHNLPAL